MAKQSTRDLILSVAVTLFATAGFRRTTMETIATAAGRGRRTVYMYFGNKAEVYNAVVDREIALIITPLKDIISSGGTQKEIIKKYAIVRLECLRALLKRNPLLLKDFSQSHNRIERLREKLNSLELKIVTSFFTGITLSGKNLAAGDAEALAITFMNMLRGNDRLLTVAGNYDRTVKLAEFAADLVINNLTGLTVQQ